VVVDPDNIDALELGHYRFGCDQTLDDAFALLVAGPGAR
jgi:hypothetical protein